MKLANVFLGTAGLTVLFLTSCSKLGELSADNFTVTSKMTFTPNPQLKEKGEIT